MQELETICHELRKTILKMNIISGSGHLTSSYSCLEILVSLYFGNILKYNQSNPAWSDRDYFVISKGHAAMGLYSVLAKAGFFKEEELWTFCAKNTRLGGHPSIKIPGVEATSGSLGHGLSFSSGLALGLKLEHKQNKVYCLTGDGELDEGSNWEAAMFIAQNNLNNLIWIIDKNNLQLSGTTDNVLTLGNLKNKIEAFGFEVIEINGHDCNEICNSLKRKTEKPLAIIANTEKGHGLSIANKTGWHGRKPNSDELKIFLKELNMTEEELKK